MLSDKNDMPILKHNPGVMIGKTEMTDYIDFLRKVSKKQEHARGEKKNRNIYL